MKEAIKILRDELKRMASEGVEFVAVDDESMAALRKYSASFNASPEDGNCADGAEESGKSAPDAGFAAADRSGTRGKRLKIKTASVDFKTTDIPDPKPFKLPEGGKLERWKALKNIVLSDVVCNAHVKPGKKVVFGVGNLDAKIFFCGEAPGEDEEIQGEPFVGRAGQLLTKIIGAMGLTRGDVYIGNIMNWRPELPTPHGNRPPTEAEMNYCLPYLKAQIAIVQPRVIVALGHSAMVGLLGSDPPRLMKDVRGTWNKFDGTDLMVTYHPSYLVRNPTNPAKRLVWEDMMSVMERAGMEISEKQRGYFNAK